MRVVGQWRGCELDGSSVSEADADTGRNKLITSSSLRSCSEDEGAGGGDEMRALRGESSVGKY